MAATGVSPTNTARFANLDAWPVRHVGARGQNASIGVEKVYFTGTTGQVGTAYGIPGLTVNRTGTGSYQIWYPPVKDMTIIPGIEAPTGNAYDVTIAQNNPTTGTAQVNITQFGVVTGTAAGNNGVSGTTIMTNPASGTVMNLLFISAPITKF